jgi:hypothetical protein
MPAERESLEDNAALHAERMAILQVKLREVGFLRLYGKEVMPQQFIDVGWGNDKESEDVALFGNTLPTARCQDKPSCHFFCREGLFHTIIAFDADYVDPKASAGSAAQGYLHWCRVNVTGDLKFASGIDAFRWQPPHPVAGTGEHRIMFAVFTQPEGECAVPSGAEIVAKYSRQGRLGFDVQKFAATRKLRFMGANCCRVAYDAAVTDKVIAELRDEVILDEKGKKIVAEVNDGVRRTFGKAAAETAGPAQEATPSQ